MKVFTNKTFTGHWPVGTAAIIVAESAEEAADILEIELRPRGLDQTIGSNQMIELDLTKPTCLILTDGTY